MTGKNAEPATRRALAERLRVLGVRPNTYNLAGAHPDDAVVIDCRSEGWVVFHSERGVESSISVHLDEGSACADLLARVTRDEHAFFDLVAGPARANEADRGFDTWLRERGIDRDDLAPTEWKRDDIPWLAGPYWRRYFVRISPIRRLDQRI